MTVERVEAVLRRTLKDDLEEMKLDRQALEELVIEDEARVQDLTQQMRDLTAQLELAQAKLDSDRLRLKSRISSIASLEVDANG